jgi:hypothetical protein
MRHFRFASDPVLLAAPCGSRDMPIENAAQRSVKQNGQKCKDSKEWPSSRAILRQAFGHARANRRDVFLSLPVIFLLFVLTAFFRSLRAGAGKRRRF